MLSPVRGHDEPARQIGDQKNETEIKNELLAWPSIFEECSLAAAAADDSASFSELLPFLSESSALPFSTTFSFPEAGHKSSMHTALGPGHCYDLRHFIHR